MQFQGDLFQLGIVVRNIDAGMAMWRDLAGVDVFWRLDTDYLGRYRDWTGRFANRNAFAKAGALYLELVEPVIGEGNAKEWLNTRGEGIFHLGYAVDDMNQRPCGAECVFESWGARMENGEAAVIHLDTMATLGHYTEFTHRPTADALNATIDRELARLRDAR